MSAELKSCPFCGCEATFVKHSAGMPGTQGFDKWDAVACKHCRATVGACDRRFRDRSDAAEAWNRRIQVQPVAVSHDLLKALQCALVALEAISDEMTVGDRYTNAGQHLIDSLMPVRAAIAKATGGAA